MSQVQKQAHEFDTLTALNEYKTDPVYTEISSNQAEQFFGLAGQLPILEANVSNDTPAELIPHLPTTIGSVIRTILATMAKSSGTFTIDPAKTAGQLNIAAAGLLVTENILPQPVVDAFFGIGISTSMPYAEYDQAMLDQAKADFALQTPVDAYSYTIQNITNDPNAYIVKTNREVIIDGIFDAPVTKACTITVEVLLEDKATGLYIPENKKIKINVPIGSRGQSDRIVSTKGFSARKMKFSATCDYGFPFQLMVAEA